MRASYPDTKPSEVFLNRRQQRGRFRLGVRMRPLHGVFEIAKHLIPNLIAPHRLVQPDFDGAQERVAQR
jgi:hypothetical protein